MKKSGIILFAFFYLLLASGLTVNLHYCGSKIKGIAINRSHDEKGCCGDTEKSKSCCHDKVSFIKVKDDQCFSSKIDFNVIGHLILSPVFNQSYQLHKTDVDFKAINNHSPPVSYGNPIYLKQKVFII